MTRDDLILATALILFAAFALGWICCWIIGRLTRPGRAEFDRHDRLAADLHEAEIRPRSGRRRSQGARGGAA